MKCPECQNEMTSSHKGFLCLHCGHVETVSPHDVALTPTDMTPNMAVPSLPSAPPINAAATSNEPTPSLISTHTSSQLDAAKAAEVAPLASVAEAKTLPEAGGASVVSSITEAALSQRTVEETVPVELTAPIIEHGDVFLAEANLTPIVADAPEELPNAAPPEPIAPPPYSVQPVVEAAAPDPIEPVDASMNIAEAPVAASVPSAVETSSAVELEADMPDTVPAPPEATPAAAQITQSIPTPIASSSSVSSVPKVMDGLAAKPKSSVISEQNSPLVLAASSPTVLSTVQAETQPNEISGAMVAMVIALCVITVGGLGTAGYMFIIR